VLAFALGTAAMLAIDSVSIREGAILTTRLRLQCLIACLSSQARKRIARRSGRYSIYVYETDIGLFNLALIFANTHFTVVSGDKNSVASVLCIGVYPNGFPYSETKI
jgi:hypothetical protein